MSGYASQTLQGFSMSATGTVGAAPAELSCDVEILLQAQVLNLLEPTKNGSLVKVLTPAWVEIYRAIEREPDLIFEFSRHPRKFEEFIAASYEKAGWDRVEITPAKGDGGRDVIAEKHGFGAVRILDQCKAFSKGHLVGHNDVRAMQGVLAGDANASKAIITTTSDFAPGIYTDEEYQKYVPYRLELRNGRDLQDWLRAMNDVQAD